MRQVVEVATFWGGELFSIEYVRPGKRLDVPEGLEVRTRLVDAASRMPRAPMDVPYLAIAAIAACAHGLVVASYARTISIESVVGTRYVGVSSGEIADGEDTAAGGETRHATVWESPHQDAEASIGEAEPTSSLEEAGAFGMIDLLRSHGGAGVSASPWVPEREKGDLWGDRVGDAFGVAGVSLSGAGEGGGGRGEGIAIDRFGAGARGIPCDDTCMEKLGHGHGVLVGRRANVIHCTLVSIAPTVSGRLPSEAIQRVVRDNFGRFRGCYERGLARNPSLAGRVSTKFVIARDGTVAAAEDAGSELADDEVTACMRRTFSGLEFPASPSGVVTVVYPIELSPTP